MHSPTFYIIIICSYKCRIKYCMSNKSCLFLYIFWLYEMNKTSWTHSIYAKDLHLDWGEKIWKLDFYSCNSVSKIGLMIYFILYPVSSMALTLCGNSEMGAYVWRYRGYVNCLRHLFRSTAATNLIYKKNGISSHVRNLFWVTI